MRFRMLGPLRVRTGAGWAPVAAEQQRVVLALLLIEAGRSVSTERLADAVWGETPPRRAINTIHAYVMRLRQLLGPGVLVTRGRGYELVAAKDDIDAVVFENLVAAGRGELDRGLTEAGAARLAEALELWQGSVLEDVPSGPALAARVTYLDQMRLAVQEDHVGALVDLGRHAAVLDALHRLIEDSPLRERRWVLLMRALAANGRRAEALQAFHRARRALREELGLEPGPQLREAQRAILAEGTQTRSARAPTVPAELAPDVPAFTGRRDHLALLDGLLSGDDGPPAEAVVSALQGAAGVGKTALAVHWAHRVRRHFRDGQLYQNLRGYAAGPPMRPVEVLSRFLRALGVPAAQVPADVDEAGAMYRGLLDGKRVLVLLDNARDADQVRPLLPATPGCLALVTSRDRLGGLIARDGAVALTLDVLTDAEAATLLERVLGAGRVAADPVAATELARLCGNLPLALRVAAANLHARPHTGIHDYVARLAGDRLDGLDLAGDPHAGVRAAFDLSYTALPADVRRLFRQLSLVPGADVTAPVAAALTGTEPPRAARLLDRLATAHLVDERVVGRYTMHDLVREYAAERSTVDDTETGRRAAVDRLYAYYQRHVDAAARMLYPEVARMAAPAAPAALFADGTAATAWLDEERANLVSAIRDSATPTLARRGCLLADALRGYLHRGTHLVDWDAVARAALACAEVDGDPRSRAAAYLSLSGQRMTCGWYESTIEAGRSTVTFARQARWPDGQAAALNAIGTAYAELGQLDQAAGCYQEALAIDRASGRIVNQAIRLGNLGSIELMRGQLDTAVGHFTEALAIHRQTGSAVGEALTLDHLGMTLHTLGHLDEALEIHSDAAARFAELGSPAGEAASIRAVAAVHRDAGRPREALELVERALSVAVELGHRKHHADSLVTRASIRCELGEIAAAIDDYQQAVAMARDIGHRYIQTEALIGLAVAHRRDGDPEAATEAAGTAATIARQAGYRLLEDRALAVLNQVPVGG